MTSIHPKTELDELEDELTMDELEEELEEEDDAMLELELEIELDDEEEAHITCVVTVCEVLSAGFNSVSINPHTTTLSEVGEVIVATFWIVVHAADIGT